MSIVLKTRADKAASSTGDPASVLDVHVSREQLFGILVREQENRLRHVVDAAVGEAGLVVGDERHHVTARDVAGVDDREPGGVEGEANPPDPAAGDGRPDRAGVRAGPARQVVHVTRCPGSLGCAVLASDVPPDGSTHLGLSAGPTGPAPQPGAAIIAPAW